MEVFLAGKGQAMKQRICVKTLIYCVVTVIAIMIILGILGVRIVYDPARPINWDTTATILGAVATVFVGIAAVYIANKGNKQSVLIAKQGQEQSALIAEQGNNLLLKMNEDAEKERLMDKVREAAEDANQMFYPTFFTKDILKLQKEKLRTVQQHMLREVHAQTLKFLAKNEHFAGEQLFSINEPYVASIMDYSKKAIDIIRSKDHTSTDKLLVALSGLRSEHQEEILMQGNQYIAKARELLYGDETS